MTETFGLTARPDRGAHEGDQGSRRNLLVAAGLACVLAMGGAYFLLSGGPDDATTAVALRSPSHLTVAARHAAPAPATSKAAPAAVQPAVSTEHLGRNPFKALYVQPAAATGSGSTGGTATGTTPAGSGPSGSGPSGSGPSGSGPSGSGSSGSGSSGSGSSGSGSSGSGPSASSGTGDGGSTTPPGTTAGTASYGLRLVSISRPSPEARFFTFTVAGVRRTVLPGQRFGTYAELVVLAYTRASDGTPTGALVQVGDDSPVDVRIGEKITVL